MLQILWNVLSAVICFIASLLLLFVLYVVLGLFSITPDFLNTPVGASVAFAIPTLVIYAIFGSIFYGFPDYFHPAKDKPTRWSDRMRTSTPLHYKTAQKQCLPYIVIALVIVALRAIFWRQLNDAITNFLLEKLPSPDQSDAVKDLTMVIFGLLSCYVTITLVSTIKLPVACKLHSCPKCHNMCSYEFVRTAGYEVVTSTKQKVEVDTGYVVEEHQSVTTTPKCLCRCHFCGDTKMMQDRHRETKYEKKY